MLSKKGTPEIKDVSEPQTVWGKGGTLACACKAPVMCGATEIFLTMVKTVAESRSSENGRKDKASS